MKLSQFGWGGSELAFLCGQSFSSRTFSSIHLVSTLEDALLAAPDSLLALDAPCIRDPQLLNSVIGAAVSRRAAGLAVLENEAISLTEAEIAMLTVHGIFVAVLPFGCNYHWMTFQFHTEQEASLEWQPRLLQFYEKLSELSCRPFTASEVLAELNDVLQSPVDLIEGRNFRNVVSHDTLGILNVNAMVARNLESLVLTDSMGVYYNGNLAAAIWPLKKTFAFLVINLAKRRPISSFDNAVIQAATPYLTLALQRVSRPFHAHSRDELLHRILQGSCSIAGFSLRREASMLGINYQLPRIVLILELHKPFPPEMFSSVKLFLQEQTDDFYLQPFKTRMALVLPEELVVGEGQSYRLLSLLFMRLRDRFSDFQPAISISKPCRSLGHLKEAYAEAKFSMIFGSKMAPESSIYRYDDYMLHHILCDIWGEPVLEQVYRSTIARILESEHAVILLDTLEAFIKYDYNISQTAKEMNIHRNTLYKRLTRIEGLLGLDLSNSETHILLSIAIRMEHIKRVFPQTETNTSWTLE